jgi:hypothetical protein
MTNATTERAPEFGAVWREQLRIVGLAIRREAIMVATLLGLVCLAGVVMARVPALSALIDNELANVRLDPGEPSWGIWGVLAAFAGLALVIAAIGVLGVLAFTVSQRTREFGVCMALGPERGQVLAMVLREGALLAGGALVVGTVAAATLSRFLVGLLYEVEATDPATYVGVGVILATVALIAAYVPAKRATRVDPMEALRSE